MGGIRRNFGPISIESRRTTFYIHADYGYRPKRVARRDLMPGEWFRYSGRHYESLWEVHSITQVEIVTQDGGRAPRDIFQVVLCDQQGDPVDVEEDPDSGHFGEHWRNTPHPEFLNADIPHLIAALKELRDNPR